MNRLITREHEIIRQARIRLWLSQQQVATLISIQIRQYQRLEYGESDVQKLGMRAGLSLCIVLELDPYRRKPSRHSRSVHHAPAERTGEAAPGARSGEVGCSRGIKATSRGKTGALKVR